MTSPDPITPNEQNARSRRSTYGIRPDLYEALHAYMVKKTDLESLLPSYGSCYITGSGNSSGSQFLPFNGVRTPGRGCDIRQDGGITFNKIGFWTVSVMTNTMIALYAGGSGQSRIRLELFAPDGTFVRRKDGILQLPAGVLATSMQNMSLTMDLVADQPGYYVRVYQWQNSAQGVETLRGEEFSELSARLIDVYRGGL